jgi:hypothetical protein
MRRQLRLNWKGLFVVAASLEVSVGGEGPMAAGFTTDYGRENGTLGSSENPHGGPTTLRSRWIKHVLLDQGSHMRAPGTSRIAIVQFSPIQGV